MKSLNSPPEKHKETYEVVISLYLDYEKLVDYALSPSGSYNSYTKETQSLISDFLRKYEELKVRIPE